MIWDIKRTDKEYTFYISIKSFKQLKPIVKKSHSKITIKERHGFPFFLYRNRHRKMYFIGIGIFGTILYVLSLFIWDISLEGNYSHTEEEIVEYLADCGVKHGLFKTSVNCEEIEDLIRNSYFDITWVSAEISGTRLIIHIKENFDNFIIEEEKDPYNLISNKDGVIVSIITRSGTPLVDVGTQVKQGDVLVSGAVDIYNDNKEISRTEYVNADADIFAKTVYQYEEKIYYNYNEKKYTGKDKNSYFCYFYNKILSLKIGKVKFDKFDTITNETQVKIARNYYLPIFYGKTTYHEYVEKDKKYTRDEVTSLANEHYQLYLKNLVKNSIQIIEKDVKIEFNDDYCVVSGPITVIERLGTIQPIDFNTIEENPTTENAS